MDSYQTLTLDSSHLVCAPLGTHEIDLREQLKLLNQNLQDTDQQLQEFEERYQVDVLGFRQKDVTIEELRQRMTK
ncbi:hypothetical protein PIB30_101292, partial [Stylosanthes scabra]|nr:hypothetical protein [Stylosanthes scabra]